MVKTLCLVVCGSTLPHMRYARTARTLRLSAKVPRETIRMNGAAGGSVGLASLLRHLLAEKESPT